MTNLLHWNDKRVIKYSLEVCCVETAFLTSAVWSPGTFLSIQRQPWILWCSERSVPSASISMQGIYHFKIVNHVSSVTTIRRWKHRCIPTFTLIHLRDDPSSNPLYCRLSLLPIKGDSTHIVSVGGTTGMPKSLANELGYAGTSERWHSAHVYIFESSSCSIELIRRGFFICNWASN
jgi:hypothetical protein